MDKNKQENNKPHCKYRDPEGFLCHNLAGESGYCFWHDTEFDKSDLNIKKKLEDYAERGGMLRGVCLKKADLSGIDLVNHHSKKGYDFSYADFYRTNLSNAHLFNSNMKNASLMKANLRDANLNCANIEGANLLGARWRGAKVENTKFGPKIRQEALAIQASKMKEKEKAVDLYEQAEEIYRDLRKHSESEGIFVLSGVFIQKELTMRRMQMPRFSIKRITSKVIDIFCGYGEAPLRIVGISLAMILFCALLYSITGLNYQGEVLTFANQDSITDKVHLLFSCLYYSVVTFTTLGYGDFTPVGISRAIAAIEAFTGSFTIALFVVVFVKKMTR